MSIFDAAVEDEVVPTDKLEALAVLVAKQKRLEAEIEKAEADLKEIKKNLEQVSGTDIPDLLQETGLSEIRLTDGTKVKVVKDYRVGTTGKYRVPIIQWCKSTGRADMIRVQVQADFGPGENEKAEEVRKAASEAGAKTKSSEGVNALSFKALIKELSEKGEDVPYDDLGVFEFSKTKLEG